MTFAECWILSQAMSSIVLLTKIDKLRFACTPSASRWRVPCSYQHWRQILVTFWCLAGKDRWRLQCVCMDWDDWSSGFSVWRFSFYHPQACPCCLKWKQQRDTRITESNMGQTRSDPWLAGFRMPVDWMYKDLSETRSSCNHFGLGRPSFDPSAASCRQCQMNGLSAGQTSWGWVVGPMWCEMTLLSCFLVASTKLWLVWEWGFKINFRPWTSLASMDMTRRFAMYFKQYPSNQIFCHWFLGVVTVWEV